MSSFGAPAFGSGNITSIALNQNPSISSGFNLGSNSTGPLFGSSNSATGIKNPPSSTLFGGMPFSFTQTPNNGLNFGNANLQPVQSSAAADPTKSTLNFGIIPTTQPAFNLSITPSNVFTNASSTSSGINVQSQGLSFSNSIFGSKPIVTSSSTISGSNTSPFSTTSSSLVTQPSLLSGLNTINNLSTTSGSSSSSLFGVGGSLSYGQKSTTSTTSVITSGLSSSSSNITTTPTTTNSSLDSLNALKKTPTTTITEPQPSTGLSFGSFQPKVQVTTTPSLSFGLNSNVAPSTPIIATSSSTSTTNTTGGQGGKPAAVLTYRQLEEMVNKWTLELEDQERHFMKETSKLNNWDRILVQNATKINDLQSKMNHCESEQKRIEQDLEFIESQQRDLEAMLEPLENSARDFPPSQQHVDAEREAIFQMAISADFELGQMLMDLQHLASRVNNATGVLSGDQITGSRVSTKMDQSILTGSSVSNSELINQLTKILNAHMHSLNYIHNSSRIFVSLINSLLS